MKTTAYLMGVWLLVLLGFTQAWAAESKEVERIEASIDILEDITAIPEKSIPPALLENAEAIAVIPSVYKAGFVVGGRYGKGVVSVRDDQGTWQNPIFIVLAGGSVGWQIGAQATDLVLVFKKRKNVEAIKQGKFTLGADAAVAAGPVGRKAEAATDIKLESEIYSYSRSRGLFAGISLEGAALQVDTQANQDFYGAPLARIEELENVPAAANNFKQALRKYVNK